jgi:hypothetical protein
MMIRFRRNVAGLLQRVLAECVLMKHGRVWHVDYNTHEILYVVSSVS